jgi:hypothetical protein
VESSTTVRRAGNPAAIDQGSHRVSEFGKAISRTAT